MAIGLAGTLRAGVAAYALSFTVAAFGYERVRSVWVPAGAFAAYLTVVSWELVVLVGGLF